MDENPAGGNGISPYDEMIPQIRACLKQAKSVSIVAKTGSGVLTTFGRELEDLLQKRKGKVRMILVKPEDGQLRMLANSSRFLSYGAAPLKPEPKSANAASLPNRIRLFLCYASPDRKRVEKIYERLRNDGFEPWMDRANIKVAEDWPRAIRQAIMGADFMLMLLSNNCRQRGPVWKFEIETALHLREKREGFLVPVRMEDCKLPSGLKILENLNWINLYEKDGFKRLSDQLRETMANRHQSDRVPETVQKIMENKKNETELVISGMLNLQRQLDLPQNLEVSTLDHLPPWMLILTNADSPNGMGFVEIGAYRWLPSACPALMLHAERDRKWFDYFKDQFEMMWKDSREAIVD